MSTGIMKVILKIALVIIIIQALLVTAGVIFFKYKGTHYYKFTKTEQPIEKQYTALGAHEISFAEFKAEDETIKKYEIWYPKELESNYMKYPVVVVANGTGIPASSYRNRWPFTGWRWSN